MHFPWLFPGHSDFPAIRTSTAGLTTKQSPTGRAELGRVACSVVALGLLRSLGSPSDLLYSLRKQHPS